ncbi:hypothetical protein KP509_20G040400 [Ceratopteris richardii]|nr:hypothetical protein KP509_20G040400 [Ceratopteris richardii]
MLNLKSLFTTVSFPTETVLPQQCYPNKAFYLNVS